MLRGNLSSRPFYNERLVSAAFVLVGLIALALTVFNGVRLHALSKQRSALNGRIARDAAQAQQIERGAVALQHTVDRQALTLLAGSTQEANLLIDERTFSWTAFFGFIEKTLPIDLRLIAVAPRVEKGEIKVTMGVIGRQPDDVDTFMDALQETGAFYDVRPKTMERNDDDGTYRADVEAFYLPPNQSVPVRKGARTGKAVGKGQP